MWLLNFLLGAWQAVVDWFSSNYWVLRSLIYNLPNTINALSANITYYYNLAKKDASAIFTAFYNMYVAPLVANAQALLASVQAIATKAYNDIAAFVADLPNKLNNLKDTIFALIAAKYDALITGINNGLSKLIKQDIPALFGYINTLLPFQAWIAKAASLLNIGSITKIVDDITRWHDMLTKFVANPMGFILGLFWSVALQFLAFVLGYALGTTKYELPAIPDWNNLKPKQ